MFLASLLFEQRALLAEIQKYRRTHLYPIQTNVSTTSWLEPAPQGFVRFRGCWNVVLLLFGVIQICRTEYSTRSTLPSPRHKGICFLCPDWTPITLDNITRNICALCECVPGDLGFTQSRDSDRLSRTRASAQSRILQSLWFSSYHHSVWTHNIFVWLIHGQRLIYLTICWQRPLL